MFHPDVGCDESRVFRQVGHYVVIHLLAELLAYSVQDNLVAPGYGQVPGHIADQIYGVLKLPGIGFVSQHGKFEGELSPVHADILVDPIREGFHQTKYFRFGYFHHLAGFAGELQCPEKLVSLHQSRVQHLGKAARGDPAQQVHLPHAVLGHYISHRTVKILPVAGIDMGNSQ